MDTRYLNLGVILRRFFPKQLGTVPLIIIWAVVFIFNILAIILIQNTCIYTVADYSKEGLQEHTYFKEYNVQVVAEIATSNRNLVPDRYVIYENTEGEKRIVCLDSFPLNIIKRAHIKQSTDKPVNADGSIQIKEGNAISQRDYVMTALSNDPLAGIWQTYNVAALVGIYLILAFVLLMIEFMIYALFSKYVAFRE